MAKGYLVLETGDVFQGELIGTKQESPGEVVFNTSMTGYQEVLTDPSYAGQIVTFCYPLIGNYGINALDNEATNPHLAGVIVGETCEHPSHHQAAQTFSEFLEQSNISGLAGVDTRALVKLIRNHSTLRGQIVSREPASSAMHCPEWKEWLRRMTTDQFWVVKVAATKVTTFENRGPHIALVDYGHKRSIFRSFAKLGCKVSIVPYDFTYEQMLALNPDGVVFSNGPGNPLQLSPWFDQIRQISTTFPALGICLGHQVLSLAHGAQTQKARFGHRGGNHPVRELASGKIFITSQNHGYEVLEESLDPACWTITFKNVNDNSIEGLRHNTLPIQTIQFHPEAHPGPNDTAHILKDFLHQLGRLGERDYAIT